MTLPLTGQPDRPRESPGKLAEFVLVSAALSIALLIIFAPWRATALELRDFSEFLPLLESRETFAGQWQTLNEYYRTQGRGNVLTTGLIVAGWHLAGKSAPVWQFYQLAFLVGLVISLYVFLRAAGVGRVVAIGLSMWSAWSAGPAAGALRLTAELPIAVLLVAMIWIGRERDSSVTGAIVLAVLAGAMLLFKEAAVVFLPVVAGAVMSSRGRPVAKVTTVLLVGAVTTLLLARAVGIARHAPHDAYSRGLDPQHTNAFTIVAAARLVSPDHWPWMSPMQPLTSWATLAWLGIVVTGCIGAAKRGRALQVAGLVMTCAGGLALYAAWGRFESFYAAPFLVMQAATAGPGFGNRRGRETWPVVIAAVVIVIGAAHAAAGACRFREFTAARRAVEFEAAEAISRLGSEREVTIVAQTQPAQAWQGNAATFTRFVRAMWPDRPTPKIGDARCAEAQTMNSADRMFLVYDAEHCDGLPVTQSIRRDFRAVSILPPRRIHDAYVLGMSGLDRR